MERLVLGGLVSLYSQSGRLGVGGSNPLAPTIKKPRNSGLFALLGHSGYRERKANKNTENHRNATETTGVFRRRSCRPFRIACRPRPRFNGRHGRCPTNENRQDARLRRARSVDLLRELSIPRRSSATAGRTPFGCPTSSPSSLVRLAAGTARTSGRIGIWSRHMHDRGWGGNWPRGR
jgi:hypothetical protein